MKNLPIRTQNGEGFLIDSIVFVEEQKISRLVDAIKTNTAVSKCHVHHFYIYVCVLAYLPKTIDVAAMYTIIMIGNVNLKEI